MTCNGNFGPNFARKSRTICSLNLFPFLFHFSYEAELIPDEHQKTNILKYQMEKRPLFDMPSHLADVDLDDYDYEDDFE